MCTLISSFLGLEEAVEKLIENGANVNATNKNGNTALIAAAKFGNLN